MDRRIGWTAAALFFLGTGALAAPRPAGDPEKAMARAKTLFDEQGKPLEAEPLLRAAIDGFAARKNAAGLAEAYRTYGLFFRSPAVEKAESDIRAHGFQAPGASYDNRFAMSIAYFDLAAAILQDNDQFYGLTNIEYNKANSYIRMDDRDQACHSLDRSVDFFHKNQTAHPDQKPALPAGYDTYDAFVGQLKKDWRCP